jgi:hypothetical protein
MNDGVKILLERMQTHPEEFQGDYNKWADLINRYEKFFTASERSMINGAITNIRRDEFTTIVMEKLLAEDKPVEIDPSTFTINTMGRGNVTLNSRSFKDLAKTSIDDIMQDQLKDAVEAYKQEIRNCKKIK